MHQMSNTILAIGALFGPYRILSRLVIRGSGELYRVRDIQSERELALKVLSTNTHGDREGLNLLKLHVNELAQLSHKNILAIRDVGVENNICYAVTELIEGQTLQSKLSQFPVSWQKAVQWTIDIAEALAAAHSIGMVHGDLNPKSIYVTSDECIKILDFGLTRFSKPRVGAVMNSAPYLSPEQVAGDDADFRSDIFSLGCLLYEMISGRYAFGRPSVFETVSAIMKQEPQKLSELKKDIPLELDRIISHCLEKKRGSRYASARDLILELRQVLDLLDGRMGLPKNRHWTAAISATAIMVTLLYLKFCAAG